MLLLGELFSLQNITWGNMGSEAPTQPLFVTVTESESSQQCSRSFHFK